MSSRKASQEIYQRKIASVDQAISNQNSVVDRSSLNADLLTREAQAANKDIADNPRALGDKIKGTLAAEDANQQLSHERQKLDSLQQQKKNLETESARSRNPKTKGRFLGRVARAIGALSDVMDS